MRRSILEGFFTENDCDLEQMADDLAGMRALTVDRANDILREWLARQKTLEGVFNDYDNGRPEFEIAQRGPTHVGHLVEVRDKA